MTKGAQKERVCHSEQREESHIPLNEKDPSFHSG
jgi:hypothetical protein